MHKKKKRSKIWVFLLVAGAVLACKAAVDLNSKSMVPTADSSTPVSIIYQSKASSAQLSIPPDNLYSTNVILLRLDDRSVLMQKNSEQKIYPASLTKIMTAIVAIEHMPDLQEKISLSSSMFQSLYKEDASMAGFVPNENAKAIDLLYGALLPSGAECCIGLANHIAKSEQDFTVLMNQKAAALGMQKTHFTNTTGLQDKNHYTTVNDLSKLLVYALQNKTFRQIFTAPRYSTAPTNKHPSGFTFQSTMFQNIKNPVVNGGKILGGKTGFTDEAGLCLASLAQKNGKEYVLITAGAAGNHKSEQYNIDDAFTVYNKLQLS